MAKQAVFYDTETGTVSDSVVAALGGVLGGVETSLHLPGASTDYISAPLSLTLTDLDIRARVAPSADGRMYIASELNRWYFRTENKYLYFNFRGTGGRSVGTNTTVPALSPTNPVWVRVTLDADNGSGQNVITFYWSEDGATWTTMRTLIASGVAAIAAAAGTIYIGQYADSATSGPFAGELHRFQIASTIDGDAVASWDGRAPATRQRGPSGEMWTVAGTSSAWVVG